MGWCSGSYLAQDTWNLVRKHIPVKERKKIAKKFLAKFEDHDADDWDSTSTLCQDAGAYQNDDEG